MAQHDYNIGDQNGFDFLVDLNNALSAIVTNNAGSFEPNPTFAHMLWFDTNNDLMKVRNEANSAWVIVAKKDASGWTPYRQGTALGSAALMVDSADADLAVDPDGAARRDIVAAAIAAAAGIPAPLYTATWGPNFPSAGTNVTSNHSLGRAPRLINFYAECTTADAGYTVGDKVDGRTIIRAAGQGPQLYSNATLVGVALPGTAYWIMHRTTKTETDIFGSSSWKLVADVW